MPADTTSLELQQIQSDIVDHHHTPAYHTVSGFTWRWEMTSDNLKKALLQAVYCISGKSLETETKHNYGAILKL